MEGSAQATEAVWEGEANGTSEAIGGTQLSKSLKVSQKSMCIQPTFTTKNRYIVHEGDMHTDSEHDSDGVKSSLEGCENADTNACTNANTNTDDVGDGVGDNTEDGVDTTAWNDPSGVQLGMGVADYGGEVLAPITEGDEVAGDGLSMDSVAGNNDDSRKST
jgi:hypothetical protein